MKNYQGIDYFTTTEISEKLNKKVMTILKYARTRDDILKIGSKQATKYLWTQKNIDDYIEYNKNIKLGRPKNKSFNETENYDTLYHRMTRAKQKGDIKRYEETKALIEELKYKKKQNPKKRKRKCDIE